MKQLLCDWFDARMGYFKMGKSRFVVTGWDGWMLHAMAQLVQHLSGRLLLIAAMGWEN